MILLKLLNGLLQGNQLIIRKSFFASDVTATIFIKCYRADRILVFFDANKLDISDELVKILKGIDRHVEKIRVVFNKADTLGKEEFLRTYGSLMWGIGKVFQTPEALKIYVGSFWEEPFKSEEWEKLFTEDQALLFEDIKKLPLVSATRKIGDFTKRLRVLQAYVLVMNELHSQIPLSKFDKNLDCLIA